MNRPTFFYVLTALCSQVLLSVCAILLCIPSFATAQNSKISPAESSLAATMQSLYNSAKYEEAKAAATSLLSIAEKKYGKESVNTAICLRKIAECEAQLGKYIAAVECQKKVLAIYRKKTDDKRKYVAQSLNSLGELYNNLDLLLEAAAAHSEALKIRLILNGKSSPLTAESQRNLANIYTRTGRYADAESLLNDSIATFTTTVGANSVSVGITWSYAASLATLAGNPQKGELLYLKSLAILRQKLAPGHPDVAHITSALAGCLLKGAKYDDALKYCTDALKMKEQMMGKENPLMADEYLVLGIAHLKSKRYEQAETALELCLRLARKLKGENSILERACLANLADLHFRRGEYKDAEPLFRQVVASGATGRDHSVDLGASLHNLAFNCIFNNQKEEALALASKVGKIRQKDWQAIVSYGSEKDLVQASQKLNTLDLPATLEDAELTEEASLWTKGLILDQMLRYKRLGKAAETAPATSKLYNELVNLKDKYRNQFLSVRSNAQIKDVEALEDQIEKLQKSLAGALGSEGPTLIPSVGDVRKTLSGQQILIDFIWYNHGIGKGQFEERYAAVLITKENVPKFVNLGKSESIDLLVRAFLKHFDAPYTNSAGTPMQDACRSLYDAVIGPMAQHLNPSMNEIIVCPDGLLNFIPFTALLDKDLAFLVNKFNIRTISTARDLLRTSESMHNSKEKHVVLLGGATYDSAINSTAKTGAYEKTEQAKTRAAWLSAGKSLDLSSVHFSDLQGASLEVIGLDRDFRNAGWTTSSLAGSDATFENLSRVLSQPIKPGPNILHIATHGFVLDELTIVKETTSIWSK